MSNQIEESRNPGEPEAPTRTRESLEGAVAQPVAADEEGLQGLIAGRAEGVKSSARRSSRPARRGGAFAHALVDELEPETVASGKARGTAKLQGAAAPPEDGEDGAKDDGGAKRRRRVPLAFKVLAGLLAMLAVVAGAVWSWVASIESEMSVNEEDRLALEEALSTPTSQTEPFYALIIGSDAREMGEVSRSDVIMLARVDAANATISLVSIPRDTMILRDDGSVVKINSLYNYGPGPIVEGVSEFAGVEISHYVQVDFNGLAAVVDALGGITVDVPEDVQMSSTNMSLSAGEQVLNGEQALAYARERYNVSSGDFGRTRAQRLIVEAIVRQVLASDPTVMPRIITELARSITTDLSVPDIISYALDLQPASAGLRIYSVACPSYALWQDGVSYVGTMYDEWRQVMQRVDAGLDPDDESAEIPQEQLENELLGSAANAAGPKDYHELAEMSLNTDDVVE